MANIFTDDSRIIEFWRFENNLTAGKAGNNLSEQNTPTYNSASPLEGSYSLDLEASSLQVVYRTDTNLSAGFPLKSGDTTKKISVAFWMRPESIDTLGFMLAKWNTGAVKRTFAIDKNNADLRVSIGYNAGANGETWTVVSTLFVAGQDYHIGVAVDGVNKTALVRVWDKTNETVTTYTHDFTNEMNVEDADFAIGKISSGSYYDGLIDELVVANDLLSVDDFDKIRQGIFGTSFTGTGAATQSPTVASGTAGHGVAGAAAPACSPAVAVADGYVQVSGTGQANIGPSQAVATGTHGVAGVGVADTSPAITAADGFSGILITGTGGCVTSPSVTSAIGTHGVSGTGQSSENPVAASALGAHGVSGQGAAVNLPALAAAGGYCQVSGVGQAARIPVIAAADGYQGFLITGVAQIVQTPVRMIAYGTFIDPLGARAKRFFEPITGGVLRQQALIWVNAEVIDPNLRVASLKWLNKEIKKAA